MTEWHQSPFRRARELATAAHLPRRTVRARLTLLYGGLFLLGGIGLLTTTYFLVRRATDTYLFWRGDSNTPGDSSRALALAVKGLSSAPTRGTPTFLGPHGKAKPASAAQLHLAQQLEGALGRQHAADLHQLLIQSGVALVIMALLALALGWLVAGRALRPLRTMRTTTQQISEHNLHERLALGGPRDELTDLADTIDGLLGRLEAAFCAQRRFVAHASHELRTPLTFQRALVEVSLADPQASVKDLRTTCEEVLASGERQEHLIDALLTLASSERGLERRGTFDLAEVTSAVLEAHRADLASHDLRINAALGPAPASGSRALVERLVANLVDNACFHNVEGGWVEVVTGTRTAHALLLVRNSGLLVPPGDLPRLFQPFEQLEQDRAQQEKGFGLGLSIVQAIAVAHGATVTPRALADGGLEVEVSFPSLRTAMCQTSLSRPTTS